MIQGTFPARATGHAPDMAEAFALRPIKPACYDVRAMRAHLRVVTILCRNARGVGAVDVEESR